jgi:hypothetical protein
LGSNVEPTSYQTETDGRLAVGMDDDAQAAGQRELLIGDVDLPDERGRRHRLVILRERGRGERGETRAEQGETLQLHGRDILEGVLLLYSGEAGGDATSILSTTEESTAGKPARHAPAARPA